jgi:hypothetical protein
LSTGDNWKIVNKNLGNVYGDQKPRQKQERKPNALNATKNTYPRTLVQK